MVNKITKILIVGAGQAGVALIKKLNADVSVEIAGVIDPDLKAPGIKLAQQMKIPVAKGWDEMFNRDDLNEVINTTGDNQVHEQLCQQKPECTILTSGLMSEVLSFFAKEYETVEQKIQEVKEDVEAQEWGIQKTNEAIKTLYTELEEKNKELKELDRLKSDFIATVSHELRTPLAITKEGITLIQDGILGLVNEKQAKVLETSKDSIDRLARLITGLLDISKIEAGNQEIKKSVMSITTAASQAVSFFEKKAGDQGLAIRVNLPEFDVNVLADNDKIIQVFTNLINNSIKFTESGHVTVFVKEGDEEIECGVEDTGKGVSKEDIPKMFVKFQQINRIHGDGEKGTGLGLSIVKGIVEAHDGQIRVESEEGRGTKITFTLPKHSDEQLLKKYVDNCVQEAEENNSKMSLMVVSISNLEEAQKTFSEEELYSILKEVEVVLKDSLDHAEAVTLKDSYECAMILLNSNAQGVLSAEGRLKQAVDDYLTRKKLVNKIELKFGCATYPDEACSSQDVIDQALKA